MQVEKTKSYFKKFFIIGILSVVSLAFVFVGVFPTLTDMVTGGNYVAVVDGEPISATEYLRRFRQNMAPYNSLGKKIPEVFVQRLRDQTLMELVNAKLLQLYAKDLGFLVSDQEVGYFIEKQESFKNKETKEFDLDLYRNLLAANNLSVGVYEKLIREDLVRTKLLNYLRQRIFVTNQELKHDYEIANRKRVIEYIYIRAEDAYPKMKLSNEELDSFLKDENKLASARNYYKENEKKYKKGEQICARHIVFIGPSEEQAAKAKEKIDKISVTKENFVEMASKHSQGPTKSKGGDLGCFEKGVMGKRFEDAAFSMKKGTLSPPVQSDFGWHYIYVYDKKPGHEKSFDMVKKDIAEELLKKSRFSEVQEINKKTAENYQKNWSSGPSKKKSTPFTELTKNIPGIGRAPMLIQASFDPKAKIQKEPQIFESVGAVIVAKVVKNTEPDYSKLDKDRENHKKRLREKKLSILLPAWMDSVRKKTSVKTNGSLVKRLSGT